MKSVFKHAISYDDFKSWDKILILKKKSWYEIFISWFEIFQIKKWTHKFMLCKKRSHNLYLSIIYFIHEQNLYFYIFKYMSQFRVAWSLRKILLKDNLTSLLLFNHLYLIFFYFVSYYYLYIFIIKNNM